MGCELMLYQLGTLALDTRPFNADAVRRHATADLASKGVMGGLDPSEFMGEGTDTITLSGQLLPSKIGGLTELETAHEMRRNGARFPVMRGDGRCLGWFAITRISENHRELLRTGVGFIVHHRITMKKVQADAGAGQQIITALLSLFDGI